MPIMINPVEIRLDPVVFTDEDYMKRRVRQEQDFVNKQILQGMTYNKSLHEALLQNAHTRQIEAHYNQTIVFETSLFIVPALQVLNERARYNQPQYNGERVIKRMY